MGRVSRTGPGLVILLTLFNWACCADPVLTPRTLTDAAGNSADDNSTIKWAPLPSFDPYKAGDIEYDSSGLAPLNNFAKAFIRGGVFPYGVPWGMLFFRMNYLEIITFRSLDHVAQMSWLNTTRMMV